MIPTRRTFLAGLGAALAAPAVIRTPGLLMPVHAPIPTLWGDGDRCDAEAIQALVDGMRVKFRNAIMRPLYDRVLLPEAITYVVRTPVYVPPLKTVEFMSPIGVLCGPNSAGITHFADGSWALGAPSPPRPSPA